MSSNVTPQCAVDEIHDSSDCSKWHFGRPEMSFIHRFFLYFDPIDGSTSTGYQSPTHDTSTVLFAAPFVASLVLINCAKISKLKLLFRHFEHGDSAQMENDERTEPDGSTDSPSTRHSLPFLLKQISTRRPRWTHTLASNQMHRHRPRIAHGE